MKHKLSPHYLETCRVFAVCLGGEMEADFLLTRVLQCMQASSKQADGMLQIRSLTININNFFEYELLGEEEIK